MKNIVLVGFMGTGKTAVAKILAKRLGMRYVSTDSLIEEKEKCPITEIFAKDGEAYFRKIEAEVIKNISSNEGAVIDAGGGVVKKKENIKNLKTNGVIICLTATTDAILQRTMPSKRRRPLLNVEDPKKKIKELLAERQPYYAKADFTIDTSDLSIDEVAKKIEAIVK